MALKLNMRAKTNGKDDEEEEETRMNMNTVV